MNPYQPKFPKSPEMGWCSGDFGCGIIIDRRSFSRHRQAKHSNELGQPEFQNKIDPMLPNKIDKIKNDGSEIKLRVVEHALLTGQVNTRYDIIRGTTFLELCTTKYEVRPSTRYNNVKKIRP